MKYYVRKETDHYGVFYCAYKNPNYSGYMLLDRSLEGLAEKVKSWQETTQENIGEFDTDKPVEPDDEEDVCADCGDPTDDADDEYCHPCKCARAEMAVESSMDR